MNMNEDTELNTDIDALLDGTLDDLADLPEFKPYVGGGHQVLASLALKEIKDHGMCPELSFKYIELRQLENPQDEAPKPGDEASTLFFLDNEIGQGKFKAMITVFGEHLDMIGQSNRAIIEAVTDIECVILSTVTVDKNDSTRKYLNIIDLAVV